MSEVNRRNLSGIYIFYKFDNEEERAPTCFEDCPEEKQDEWLSSLEPQAVERLAKHLAKKLRQIGDNFDIYTGDEHE